MVAFTEQFNVEQRGEYMSFRDFDTPQLMKRFQLRRTKSSPLLDNWLNTSVTIDATTAAKLEELREEMDVYSPFYNEANVRFFFINPLLTLVNYRTKHYRPFLEVPLKGEVDKLKMRGVVDLLIASGDLAPEAPYFFLHEYKKEKGTKDDVVAQLLCAMLVAQQLNNNAKPVYGCYLIGRMWIFVVLNGKEYSMSKGHIASTSDGIAEIYTALLNMKTIIEQELSS